MTLGKTRSIASPKEPGDPSQHTRHEIGRVCAERRIPNPTLMSFERPLQLIFIVFRRPHLDRLVGRTGREVPGRLSASGLGQSSDPSLTWYLDLGDTWSSTCCGH